MAADWLFEIEYPLIIVVSTGLLMMAGVSKWFALKEDFRLLDWVHIGCYAGEVAAGAWPSIRNNKIRDLCKTLFEHGSKQLHRMRRAYRMEMFKR